MDHQRREYTLEVFADQTYVKDLVKGESLLHLRVLSTLSQSASRLTYPLPL